MEFGKQCLFSLSSGRLGNIVVRVIKKEDWNKTSKNNKGTTSAAATKQLQKKSTKLKEYSQGIRISEKAWKAIEDNGGERVPPTLVNNSDHEIYYKPEHDGTAIGVGAHKDVYAEIDGVAAPHLREDAVFKATDEISVTVTNDNVDWSSNGNPLYYGVMKATGGWKDATWLYGLTANNITTTYVNGETGRTMYSATVSKWSEPGWNALYSKSGTDVAQYAQPHAIQKSQMIFFGSKF